MGDICNENDIGRFLRSAEGQSYLNKIVEVLKGKTIKDVTFYNDVHYVGTTIHLDDGNEFSFSNSQLDVEVLREEFSEVIEREYYIDYPERKPKTFAGMIDEFVVKGILNNVNKQNNE